MKTWCDLYLSFIPFCLISRLIFHYRPQLLLKFQKCSHQVVERKKWSWRSASASNFKPGQHVRSRFMFNGCLTFDSFNFQHGISVRFKALLGACICEAPPHGALDWCGKLMHWGVFENSEGSIQLSPDARVWGIVLARLRSLKPRLDPENTASLNSLKPESTKRISAYRYVFMHVL